MERLEAIARSGLTAATKFWSSLDEEGSPSRPRLLAAIAVLLATMLLGVLFFNWRRNRQQMDRKTLPLQVFLRTLADPATTADTNVAPERNGVLLGMFDPRLLQRIEPATLQAIARCVAAEFGPFRSLAPGNYKMSTRRTKSGLASTIAAGVNFTSAEGVLCEIAWVVRPRVEDKREDGTSDGSADAAVPKPTKSVAKITSFFFERHNKAPLDFFKHVRPEDFDGFGRRFLSAMMASPASAVEYMAPSLARHYQNEDTLKREMARVAVAVAGSEARTQKVPMKLKLAGACMTSVPKKPKAKDAKDAKDKSDGKDESEEPEAKEERVPVLELEYTLAGYTRDLKAVIGVVFHNMQSLVLRFSFVALPMKGAETLIKDLDADGSTDAAAPPAASAPAAATAVTAAPAETDPALRRRKNKKGGK